MSTPNVVPEGHVCHAPGIVPDCDAYTCHVCGRQWKRYIDPATREGGPWREVEPGYPIDVDTGGYWSGPTLSLVEKHWHHEQTVVLAAQVPNAAAKPTFYTLARGPEGRYGVYKFWYGPEGNWACTILAESKPLPHALGVHQGNVGTAVLEAAKE